MRNIMKRKQNQKFWVILALLVFLFSSGTNTASAAPSLSGAEVISAINGYRAAYGLSQLSTNSILTSAAQLQADYQASIQTVTHTGAGGSTARDRAASLGYSALYLSEIIYGGWNATVSTALTWWQNSTVHNNVMLSSNYTEIGAGVAVSGDTVYFTAVLAAPSGSSSSSSSSSSTSGTSDTGTTDNTEAESAPVVIPVQKATPQADGSIIHIVQEGQTIWTIEAVYELAPGTLRELNDIPSYPYVFPGDELVIRPAGSINGEDTTSSASETENPNSSANRKIAIGTPFSYVDPAKVTPTPQVVITRPVRATVEATTVASAGLFQGNSTAKTMVIAALIILIIVLIGSMFLQKPPNTPNNSNEK